jgi:hypothetical protein
MLWGVWDKRAAVYVIPTDIEGYPEYPHVVSVECFCEPEVVWGWPKAYVQHRVVRVEVDEPRTTE